MASPLSVHLRLRSTVPSLSRAGADGRQDARLRYDFAARSCRCGPRPEAPRVLDWAYA
jgi:hypothetical protein